MTGGIINRIGMKVAIALGSIVIAGTILVPAPSNATIQTCADFDGNGRVGAVDLLAVTANYSQPSPNGSPITVSDMLQVMHQNGASCSAP